MWQLWHFFLIFLMLVFDKVNYITWILLPITRGVNNTVTSYSNFFVSYWGRTTSDVQDVLVRCNVSIETSHSAVPTQYADCSTSINAQITDWPVLYILGYGLQSKLKKLKCQFLEACYTFCSHVIHTEISNHKRQAWNSVIS